MKKNSWFNFSVGYLIPNCSILLIAKYFILGNEILAGAEIYGGSSQLLNKIIPNRGIMVKLVLSSLLLILIQHPLEFNIIMLTLCSRVDTTDLADVQKNLCEMKNRKKENNLVWLESPTNPQQKISDIRVWSLSSYVNNLGYWLLFLVIYIPETTP